MPASPLLRANEFYGPDQSLDETFDSKPLSPLQLRCKVCQFPEYLHAPEPYRVRKAAMNAAGDFTIGTHSWLLAKERLRTVIELVAPNCCSFHLTYAEKTGAQTPWHLGVPLHETESNLLSFKKELPVCKACGEPLERNVNLVKEWTPLLSKYDIAALKQWHSWSRPKEPIHRQLVLSVRLIALLKKLGFKGVNPSDRLPKLDPAEQAWLDEKLEAVVAAGLTDANGSKPADAAPDWYGRWLKAQKKKPPKGAPALEELERKHQIKLPVEYHQFAAACGSATFDDVEESGLEVTVLHPSKADFKEWRKGAMTFDDDPESAEVDGIMIAETNCGDAFCFDLAATKDSQPPVLRYNHELNCYEEYADNFVSFLRRLKGVAD